MDVLLVHGYNVTSTATYGVLPQRLKSAGYNVKDVYLSKYVTLDDDITLADLARALNAALLDLYGKKYGDEKFAFITHSTGALVVREWIRVYYGENKQALPVSHLIMFAPPNFGSRLAELGKSRLGRLRSLLGTEPGLKVLDALELGSRYQWDLNDFWMEKKLHAPLGFYPVVITGQWIDKKIWDVIIPATYERGSDGVVRASAANLNCQKITISPDGSSVKEVMGGIPFLVTPKTSHADERFGIMTSIPAKGSHPVLSGILSTLEVDTREEYDQLEADFAMSTTTLQRKDTYHDGSKLDRYSQLVFRITDDTGNSLSDYAIELIDGSMAGDKLPAGFFGDKHQNQSSHEFFVYYLNYDRLSAVRGGKFGFKVQSMPDSPLVAYREVSYIVDLAAEKLLRPNETTYVDVVLKRRINKKTFELTKNISYQKITGQPGPDWIE